MLKLFTFLYDMAAAMSAGNINHEPAVTKVSAALTPKM